MRTVAWLNAEQAAAHLGFVNLGAFHDWLGRQPKNQPRRHYLGRRLRFRQVDLDACVEATSDAVESLPRLQLVNRKGR